MKLIFPITKKKMSPFIAASSLIALSFFAISSAYAEKADSQKKTNIKAENYEQVGSILNLKGNIKVTRGTLLITAEHAVYKENSDGSSSVTLTATPSSPVFFRQKRDNGEDLWMEGNADRVEYDSKTEVVKLINKASVRYLEKNKVTQAQEGDFLSYDNINDVFNGKSVSITIEPKEAKSTKK